MAEIKQKSIKQDSFDIDDAFNLKGKHLGYKGTSSNWKYCNICGEEVQADPKKLFRHCNAQHKNEEDGTVENKGWLLRGELPLQPKYLNYRDYLQNKNIEMIIVSGYSVKKAGAPFKYHNMAPKEVQI